MTKEFGDLYFPPPQTVPKVIERYFARTSAVSDLMAREEITEVLSTVSGGKSVFILTCGHEGLRDYEFLYVFSGFAFGG